MIVQSILIIACVIPSVRPPSGPQFGDKHDHDGLDHVDGGDHVDSLDHVDGGDHVDGLDHVDGVDQVPLTIQIRTQTHNFEYKSVGH